MTDTGGSIQPYTPKGDEVRALLSPGAYAADLCGKHTGTCSNRWLLPAHHTGVCDDDPAYLYSEPSTVFIVLELDGGRGAVDGVYADEAAANRRRDELNFRADDPDFALVVAKYVSTRTERT